MSEVQDLDLGYIYKMPAWISVATKKYTYIDVVKLNYALNVRKKSICVADQDFITNSESGKNESLGNWSFMSM